MPRSMTGFGQAESDGYRIEIKGLNHRYRELRLKLPRELGSLEMLLREQLTEQIKRGKVEVVITRSSPAGQEGAFAVNWPQARACEHELRAMAAEFGGEVSFREILWIPGVIQETPGDAQSELARIQTCLQQAMQDFNASKEREGARLKTDMVGRIQQLLALQEAMQREAEHVPQVYREKLATRLNVLLAGHGQDIDEMRLAQEVAILADKADITEELVRLKSHLSGFIEVLSQTKEPVGRRKQKT